MRGKLICLIGIDGAGKTTLSRETARRLQSRGVKAVCRYGRMLPVISRLLMAAGRKLFLRKQDIWQDYVNYTAHKKLALKNPLLARIYEAAVWLDYFPQTFFKITLPLSFGATVVCDRYLFDTVIGDLAVHLNYDSDQVRRSLHSSFHFLPRPDQVFFIDLPEEIAIQRKNDVPHLDYLRERRSLYLRLGKLYPMFRLDGQEKPQQLIEQIIQSIEPLFEQTKGEHGH